MEPLLVVIIIGVIIFFWIQSSSKKKRAKKVRRQTPSGRRSRSSSPRGGRHGRGRQQQKSRVPSSTVVRSGAAANPDTLYKNGLYDQARDAYLRTGRVFGAAKAEASKGDSYVPPAIELIRRHAPQNTERLARNLARFFFDRSEATRSALLLREVGLTNEADAVLAVSAPGVAGFRPSSGSSSQDVPSASSPSAAITPSTPSEVSKSKATANEGSVVVDTECAVFVSAGDVEDACSVCRSTIRPGDTYVRCPSCGGPAHYAHLMEWIKVKAECPRCKTKLRTEMFQVP